MNTHSKRVARAFTLVELITVIAVMAILITIGVPAFRAALASSDKALSEGQFRIGMELGRQVAIANASRDAAAVFMYDPYAPGGGRMSIVACVYVGTMLDWKDPTQNTPGDPVVERDIFVPVPEVKPVQLPRSWVVRAFAPPGSMHDDVRNNENGWYERTSAREFEAGAAAPVGNWVFPENAFYHNIQTTGDTSPANEAQGKDRQTFMIRFKAGTGSVDPSDARLCVVIDPAPSQLTNTTSGVITNWRENADPVFRDNRIDKATDLQRFVKMILATPDLDGGGPDVSDEVARRSLIGAVSCDAVLCRPVTELALYREKSLASALGAGGVNEATRTLYGIPGDQLNVPDSPQIDTSLFAPALSTSEIARRTNLWITGKLLENGNVGPDYVETDAKLFVMDRYLGQGRKLGDDREVTP